MLQYDMWIWLHQNQDWTIWAVKCDYVSAPQIKRTISRVPYRVNGSTKSQGVVLCGNCIRANQAIPCQCHVHIVIPPSALFQSTTPIVVTIDMGGLNNARFCVLSLSHMISVVLPHNKRHTRDWRPRTKLCTYLSCNAVLQAVIMHDADLYKSHFSTRDCCINWKAEQITLKIAWNNLIGTSCDTPLCSNMRKTSTCNSGSIKRRQWSLKSSPKLVLQDRSCFPAWVLLVTYTMQVEGTIHWHLRFLSLLQKIFMFSSMMGFEASLAGSTDEGSYLQLSCIPRQKDFAAGLRDVGLSLSWGSSVREKTS